MLVQYLNDELRRRKKRNSKYSLRAFAKSLDMDAPTLSILLNRKREISDRYKKHILSRLEIEGHQVSIMLSDERPHELMMDEFSAIADWEYFSILALLKSRPNPMSSSEIALSLGINNEDLKVQLSRLNKLNFIKEEKGHWILQIQNVTTHTDVPNEALRESHRQHIHKALRSIDEQELLERDITGLTLALPKNKMAEAVDFIAEFRAEFSKRFETESQNDDVYRLNIQLFNLMNKEKKNESKNI